MILCAAFDASPSAFILLLFGALSLTAVLWPSIGRADTTPLPGLTASSVILPFVFVLNQVLRVSAAAGAFVAVILLLAEYRLSLWLHERWRGSNS